MATEPCLCEPVGEKQIADRLGVERKTANMWKHRDVLPMPLWRVGQYPAWCWPHQIIPWAERTGRLR